MKKIYLGILILALTLFSVGLGPTPTSANDKDVKLKVFVHYPKEPGKPLSSSQCTVTTNDQINDYGLTPWQMPSAGMTYKINYSTKPGGLTDSQVLATISSSFNTWSAADPKQIFRYGGTTSAKTAKLDGTNAILWKHINGSAIAITYVWYYPATGMLAEADSIFNKTYKWSQTTYNGTNDCGGLASTYDVQNIGTHEFGHWVGLDDLYSATDRDLTMYGYGTTTELKKDSLGLGDITGVNSVAP